MRQQIAELVARPLAQFLASGRAVRRGSLACVAALLVTAIAAAAAPASGTAPAPEAEPGFYVTPPSTEFRKIVVHVGEDGNEIVGLSIKVPRVNCQHDFYLPHFDLASYLTPAEFIPIANQVGHAVIVIYPAADERPGSRLGVYVRFTSPGVVEGRLTFRLIEKNRHLGICSNTVRFKARLKTG